MPTKRPSFQFYTGDWLKDPKLSMCQPLSRGIWIDLLCAMHENEQSGEITGTVGQLSRICRCSPDEMSAALSDLSVTKTADVTICNEIVTARCRRMYKEAKERKQGRERVNRFRGKTDGNTDVTPPSSSSTSTSEEKEETNVSSKIKKGSRIPVDFYPSPEMLEWVKKNAPNIDLKARILEFKNYWEAKTGKDATKLDWNKTFQNRILQILEHLGNKNESIQRNGNGNHESAADRRNREAGERIDFDRAASDILEREGIIQTRGS
jgi:hypothetical protein